MVGPDSDWSLPSPEILRYQTTLVIISLTRLSLSLVTYSTVFCYHNQSVCLTLQPHDKSWFGLNPFRSSLTQGLSFDFFSSPYLDISVQEVPDLAYARTPDKSGGFPHSDTDGLTVLSHLPVDFRRLETSFFGFRCLGIH